MGDSLQYVPDRKISVFTNIRSKEREKRNTDREPKSHKAIKRFLKEQNGVLKGIIAACRTTPEPLEDRLEEDTVQDQQEMQE